MFFLFEDLTVFSISSTEERMFLRQVDRFLRSTEYFYRDVRSQPGMDAVRKLQIIIPELYLRYSDWHDLERGTSVLLAFRSSIRCYQKEIRDDSSPFGKRKKEQALGAYDLLDRGILGIFLQCYPDSPSVTVGLASPSGS